MEFKEYKLEEITLNITDGVHNTVKDDYSGEYYLLSCKNIKKGTINITKHERKINFETFNKLKKRTKLSKNDILITTVGTIGEMAMVKETNINYDFQRSVGIIKPNDKIVNPEFLYYSLLNEIKQINSLIKGAVQKCLFIGDIKNIIVKLPSLEQQNKIVKILSDIDKKIELNNKISDNLSNIIASNYEKYLNEIVDFEEVAANDIFDFISGVEPGSSNYSSKKHENYINFYRVGDMDGNCNNFIPKELAKNKFTDGNDVLVSFDATIGRIAYGIEGAYSTGMRKILVNPKFQNIIGSGFVYAYFNNSYTQATIKEHARGTTILHAGTSINYLKVKINRTIIKEFNLLFENLFNKIKQIKRENNSLENLKNILIPKLMNGEIDFDKIEA